MYGLIMTLMALVLVSASVLWLIDQARSTICPYCRKQVSRGAVKCPYCQSVIGG
jgi:hypothetical protein